MNALPPLPAGEGDVVDDEANKLGEKGVDVDALVFSLCRIVAFRFAAVTSRWAYALASVDTTIVMSSACPGATTSDKIGSRIGFDPIVDLVSGAVGIPCETGRCCSSIKQCATYFDIASLGNVTRRNASNLDCSDREKVLNTCAMI
jgi:hypothetical protein